MRRRPARGSHPGSVSHVSAALTPAKCGDITFGQRVGGRMIHVPAVVCDGVALLAWCVEVSDENLVDEGLEGVELGRPWWVRCPLPRPCRRQRRLHRAPANSVVTLKFSPRHARAGVTANRGKLLDSGGLPRGQGCATCRVWRRRIVP
jgi:hypothetical protein